MKPDQINRVQRGRKWARYAVLHSPDLLFSCEDSRPRARRRPRPRSLGWPRFLWTGVKHPSSPIQNRPELQTPDQNRGRGRGRRRFGCRLRRTMAKPREFGFVLWEMMLALMIFCVVAVSLTRALHQAIDTAVILRDDSEVRRNLQNILAESSVMKLTPGKTDVAIGDGRIRYEREVTRIQPKTDKNQILSNMYQVKVRARWIAQNQTRSSDADVVVYQP
jgi:type II secretory pathway pseudopilin PulG